MDRTYWFKQALDQPIFPDILWSRPENRLSAGKLLIIGGNVSAFVNVAQVYGEAEKAGIGQIKVLLPDALKKTVGKVSELYDFAPSTPSGSFNSRSLALFMQYADWADGILLPGDLGRNSETAVVLEKFLQKCSKQLTLARDATDYFRDQSLDILARQNITLVISFLDLQKLSANAKFEIPFTYDMDIIKLVDGLHLLSSLYAANIITLRQNQIFVASSGRVCSTILKEEPSSWRAKTSSIASVFWLQNPGKSFEALCGAVYEQFK